MLKGFKDSVTCLALAEYEVAAGSADGAVRSFDIRTGKVLTDLLCWRSSRSATSWNLAENSQTPPVTSICLSSDSQCLLVGVLVGLGGSGRHLGRS